MSRNSLNLWATFKSNEKGHNNDHNNNNELKKHQQHFATQKVWSTGINIRVFFLPLLLPQSCLGVCGATGVQQPVLLLGWGLVCGFEDRRTGWPHQNYHLVVPSENSHTAHHAPTFSLRSGRSSALRETKTKTTSFCLEWIHGYASQTIIIYNLHLIWRDISVTTQTNQNNGTNITLDCYIANAILSTS